MPYSQTMMYQTMPYTQMEHPASFGAAKYRSQSTDSSSKAPSTDSEVQASLQSHMAHLGIPLPANGCLPVPMNPGGPRVEMSVPIPDEKIGAIIGRGGAIITQLQTLVGVKIIISGRNEFEPGTRNRRVTIIGAPEAVQIAHMLISMKVRNQTPYTFVH